MFNATARIIGSLFFLLSITATEGYNSVAFSARPRLSTTTAPSREKTKTRRKVGFNPRKGSGGRSLVKPTSGPLEYLQDDSSISRNKDDPFHILLLGSTFEKPRITTGYVASALVYVLSMPDLEATEHAAFASEQGVTCLGTWTREECLDLGQKLQSRDLDCRVVPYCEGGSRPWQAKSANTNSDDKSFLEGGFL